jgi:hypothetical protein
MQEEKKMAAEQFETNLRQYANLRVMLDSVERGAVRHYLSAPSQAEQDASFDYLKTSLKPIHDHVWGKTAETDCTPPLIDCDGYCIDYACQHAPSE